MELIKRQFGAKFADALLKSPTLVADLAEIRAAGVRIRKLSGRCQAYSNRDKRAIYISGRCNLSYKLISLAHEKVHVLVSPTPDPKAGVTGRRDFIEMCLNAETDAIEHEVKVASELLAAGIAVDAHSLKWLRRYKRGGRAAIRKALENSYTSNTGELYPEYYGGWYDEVLKPNQRLPLRHEDGHAVRISGCCPSGIAADNPCPRFQPRVCEDLIQINLPPVDEITDEER
jgi:type VI secretion system secreted protein VgrG